MRVLTIIQARMGSKRLPGKVLKNLAGQPLISHLLDAVLKTAPAADIVIASSREAENNALEEYCAARGIAIERGDEENVAHRFFKIIEKFEPDFFIRLNADSPLLDGRIIEKGRKILLKNGDADIISTVFKKTAPPGMNVEILRAETFLKEYGNFSKGEHFEHVTKYFYEHAQRFKTLSLETGFKNEKNYQFTVDTAEDFKRAEQIFLKMDRPHTEYSLAEKCALYDEVVKENA